MEKTDIFSVYLLSDCAAILTMVVIKFLWDNIVNKRKDLVEKERED